MAGRQVAEQVVDCQASHSPRTVAAVILLLGKAYRSGWFLALGVALGPLLGYTWSRGPDMPSYADEKGNWTETIGVLSLVFEGALLLLALAAVVPERRRDRLG